MAEAVAASSCKQRINPH